MTVELSTLLASVEDAMDDAETLHQQLSGLRAAIIETMQRPSVLEASFRAVISLSHARPAFIPDDFDTDEPTPDDIRQLDEYREGQYVFPTVRAE